MRRCAFLCAIMAAVMTAATLPLPAVAGTAALAWDKCAADGGAQTRVFSCDRDDEPAHVLVGSFTLDHPMSGFCWLEATIRIYTSTGALPNWWDMYNPGACREHALAADVDFSGFPGSSCRNPWTGPTLGGLGAYYTAAHPHPVQSLSGAAEIRIGFALGTCDGATCTFLPASLMAHRTYNAFRLTISNERSSGPAACTGCAEAVCITASMELHDSTGVGEWCDTGDIGPGSAGWSCGHFVREAGLYGPVEVCRPYDGCAVVAARNRTWGAIKSLYR
jgi:hypothetical protein